jgi:hypothetical protein
MSTSPLNPLAAISLAIITYDDEGGDPAKQKVAMSKALSQLSPAAAGPWSLKWGPADNDGILAFVALNSAGTQYAVAIRGSLTDEDAAGFISNWFDDFDALVQVPWLYPQRIKGARISAGLNQALALLMGLTDPVTDLSLLDYLRKTLRPGTNVMITGHSLGGALTTLVAPWLYDQLRLGGASNANITPYTFAAPTAGNLAFAQYYDSIFPNSYRAVNTQDVIPMGYNNLAGIESNFPSPGQTLYNYSPALWWVVDLAKDYLNFNKIVYAQTNLNNVGTTKSFQGPPISNVNYSTEVVTQHAVSVYLAHV